MRLCLIFTFIFYYVKNSVKKAAPSLSKGGFLVRAIDKQVVHRIYLIYMAMKGESFIYDISFL